MIIHAYDSYCVIFSCVLHITFWLVLKKHWTTEVSYFPFQSIRFHLYMYSKPRWKDAVPKVHTTYWHTTCQCYQCLKATNLQKNYLSSYGKTDHQNDHHVTCLFVNKPHYAIDHYRVSGWEYAQSVKSCVAILWEVKVCMYLIDFNFLLSSHSDSEKIKNFTGKLWFMNSAWWHFSLHLV